MLFYSSESSRSTVTERRTAGQQVGDWSCTWGMIHTTIHLILSTTSPKCLHLTVQHHSFKHYSFYSCPSYIHLFISCILSPSFIYSFHSFMHFIDLFISFIYAFHLFIHFIHFMHFIHFIDVFMLFMLFILCISFISLIHSFIHFIHFMHFIHFIDLFMLFMLFISFILLAQDVVQSFEVGGQGARISVVKYSTSVRREFDLDKYSTKSDVLAAIDRISYQVSYRIYSVNLLILAWAANPVRLTLSSEVNKRNISLFKDNIGSKSQFLSQTRPNVWPTAEKHNSSQLESELLTYFIKYCCIVWWLSLKWKQ